MKFARSAGRAVTAGAVLALAVAGAASATYPGDSGRIAFGATGARGNVDIYSVRPNGSDLRRLTHDRSFDACAAYSPDGRRIAFCSNRTGTYQIWVMAADGSGQRQVTRNRYDALFPDLSRDGRRIAFQARDGGPQGEDIYVVGTRGGRPRRFTGAPGDDTDAAFSPDGRTIAFLSHRKGSPQIWLMRASDGRNQRPLTRRGPAQGAPDWSPDGRRIAYDAAGDIWVIGADGSHRINLTRSRTAEFGAAWSPDGRQIAYVVRGAGRRVYVMNADGSGKHPVGGTGNQLIPSWQPLP